MHGLYLRTLSTLTISSGRSLSRRVMPAVLVAMLAAADVSAALTASLARPGAPLREHDAFTLVLTLSNTGGFPVTNLSAVLGFSVPEGVAIESAPVIGASVAI